MLNIDLGHVPAESLVIPALLVAAGFIYFFPHLKNHYLSKGEEKGRNDAFVDKVGDALTELRSDVDRHEKALGKFRWEVAGIKQHLNIKSFYTEETPNGGAKGQRK